MVATLAAAKRRLLKVWDAPRERRALEYARPSLPRCFVCRNERWHHLRLPRSSNAVENVIGQLRPN